MECQIVLISEFISHTMCMTAYQEALSLACDDVRPLVNVALAMCSYADDGDIDSAKAHLLPLWVLLSFYRIYTMAQNVVISVNVSCAFILRRITKHPYFAWWNVQLF